MCKISCSIFLSEQKLDLGGVGDLQSYPAVSFVEQCYDRRFDLAKRAHQIG
jgi:hypothetical protein